MVSIACGLLTSMLLLLFFTNSATRSMASGPSMFVEHRSKFRMA